MTPLPLTGERTVPRILEERYWFRRHMAAYRLAHAVARGRVLDAGSGQGYGTALLARRRRTFGVELDEEAARHAAAAYPSVPFVRADLCHLPIADASVDAVVALQVLEHLVCADRFMAACRRVLRPGGVLVLSTPNRATFPAGLNPFHVYEYDPEELRALLEVHFPEVRLLGLRHGPRLRLVDRMLGEPLPSRLVRTSFRDLPAWLRLTVRSLTARRFRVTAHVDGALDLVAVCRTIGS